MTYFKIETEIKAEQLSRRIYQMMNPGNVETTHLFGWGTDSNGQSYILVNLDEEYPTYIKYDFDSNIDIITAILGMDQTQKDDLKSYFQTGRINLNYFIPNYLEEFMPVFQTINNAYGTN